jgi:integrase
MKKVITIAVTVREHYSKKLKKKTFSFEVEVPGPDGVRIREQGSGLSTRTEAREAGRTIELNIKKKLKDGFELSDIINKNRDTVTLEELLTIWLNSKKSNIAPKTYIFYENYSKMILKIQGFKDIKAKKLTTERIEKMVNDLIASGISSTTARHYYKVLNIAYNWALTRGYAIKNPCELMTAPKVTEHEMKVYNPDQLMLLLEAIKDMTAYTPVMLAATTGMRLGEVCGLTWSNIDLDNKHIQLKEQLQEVNGELELVPLKTAGSKRKIVLMDYTIDALKVIKEKQKADKDYLKDNYHDKDFVVCQANGEPYNPTYVSRNYRRVVKEYKHKTVVDGVKKELSLYELLGIPLIRYHDLRHSHATIMLLNGTHAKIVAERLGHADIRMTLNTYSHVLPGMQQQAVDALNKGMNKDGE